MAKGEGFDVVLLLEVDGSVVKKASNSSALHIRCLVVDLFWTGKCPSYPTSIHVNHQNQTLKFVYCIYAGGSYLGPAFLGVPHLKVSSAMFWTSGSELKIG